MSHQPIMTENTPHLKTSFLDLPPEMRNQIYRYCLVIELPFEVTSDDMLPGKMKGTIRVSNKPGSKDTMPFAPGLLRVSKQLNEEAIGIFYGENTFRFRYPWVGAKFLADKLFVSHICHVQLVLTEGNKGATFTVFSKLKSAKHLTTLTLEYRNGLALRLFPEDEIARALRVLILHIWKERKAATRVEDVTGKVRWKHAPAVTKSMSLRNKADTAAFGARVAKRLEEMIR